MAGTFAEIVAAARNKAARKRLVVSSVRKPDMEIISRAAREGLIVPLLVGDGKAAETLVKKCALRISTNMKSWM